MAQKASVAGFPGAVPRSKDGFGPRQRALPPWDANRLEKSSLLANKETNLATIMRKIVKRKVQLDREGEGDGVDGIMAQRLDRSHFFPLPKEGAGFSHAPTGPSLPKVHRATYRMIKTKASHTLETRAETYMRKKGISEMLYTPQYCSNTQLVNLFWSHAKKRRR